MDKKEDAVRWLQKGIQKRALAQVLQKPMTHKEIWLSASVITPLIQRKHITRLLHKFMEKGLVYCINPDAGQGKLFELTDYARRLMPHAFGISVKPVKAHVDWNAYSFVASASVRRYVLLELHKAHEQPKTCAALRKLLLLQHPSWLSQVHRALTELRRRRLLRCTGYTKMKRLRLYSLTLKGRNVATEMLRSASQ